MQDRPTRRRPWIAAGLLACACLCHDSGLRAAVVVPMSLSQLVVAADLVVDATVEEVKVVEGNSGPERIVQLRVSDRWKGDADAVLHVRLAGGRLGGTETRVPGVPIVEPGDRLAWFLVAHPRGGYSVLGLHQGALPAMSGPDGVARVLAPGRTTGARGGVARVPRTVAALAADVRALTAATEGR